MSLLHNALLDANEIHLGQFRKEGIPFIIHPLEVLKRLNLWNIKDERLWVVALLHDSIEDNRSAAEPIVKKYPEDIYNMVQFLTFRGRREGESHDEYNKNKSNYLEKIANIGSVESLVVKLADRYCNVMDFSTRDKKYALKYLNYAKCLTDTITSRATEIAEHFGQLTLGSLSYDFHKLREFLTPKGDGHGS